MAFKLALRTRELVTTTGSVGAASVINLAGATNSDLVRFVDTVGDTNQTIACIVSGDNIAWAECVVTVADGLPDTLTINSVITNNLGTTAAITLVGATRVFGVIPQDWNILFDLAYGNNPGTLLARGLSLWDGLAPGADGQVLSLTAGLLDWIDLPNIPVNLGDLGDVDFSTPPALHDHLQFDGTNWVPADVGFFRSLLVEDEDNPAGTTFAIDNYRASQTTGFPFLALRHYFGTKGAPAAITNGTVIGAYGFYGHDGTALGLAPTIQAEATEDWDGTSHGCRMLFSVVRNGEVLAIFPLVLDETGLSFDGSAFYNQANSPYVIGFSAPQTTAYSASQVIGHHCAAAGFTIPANFGATFGLTSKAGGTVNATASTVFSVERAVAATPNTFTQIGTITFAAGTVTPTLATTGSTAKAIADGDVIRVVSPATPDATFAGFYGTIAGSRP